MTTIRWMMLLALVGGALIPVQGAVNSRLRLAMNHPFQATLVSFLTGTAGAAVLCLAGRFRTPDWKGIAELPVWAWSGGLLGVLFVTTTLVVTPRLGATLSLALVVTGQLLASLWLDHNGALGLTRMAMSPARACGAGLLILGVALIAYSRGKG